MGREESAGDLLQCLRLPRVIGSWGIDRVIFRTLKLIEKVEIRHSDFKKYCFKFPFKGYALKKLIYKYIDINKTWKCLNFLYAYLKRHNFNNIKGTLETILI